jgi:hypothetical protein
MFKNLVQVYAMIVCLLSVIAFFILIPLIGIDIVNLCCFESRSEVWRFDTNTRFLDRKKNNFPSETALKEINSWTEAQITRHREEERETYIKDFMHSSTRSLVNSFIWLTVAGVFFWVHWWLYRREEKNKS